VQGHRLASLDGDLVFDINGIYPSAPYQPFGGFGLVDPNQGMIMQQTNATWSKVVVTNWEAILAKNLSNDFQVVLTATRQFQHLDGTWNPTDPARFIQPDEFPNNRDLSSHLFGNGDDNSNGGGRESGVAYGPYSVRLAGQYFAPWDIRVSASYVIQAGRYLGPVVIQRSSGDPLYGPATIRLANGTTQPNPLATACRFAYGTRQPAEQPTLSVALQPPPAAGLPGHGGVQVLTARRMTRSVHLAS
jgi:hypothetical protein